MSRRGRAAAPHVIDRSAVRAPTTVAVEGAGDTPILREYRAAKAEHPGAIVLARLGDFFEMFGGDAEIAAPVLAVTLTARGFGSAGRLPMCGFPAHSAPQYIRRLLGAGLTVAIWDQVGEVVPGRLVRREVTRVISPGTVVEGDFLEPAGVSRCLAVLPLPGRVGLAALDASTGDLQLTEVSGDVDASALVDECERLDVAEVVIPEGLVLPEGVARNAPRTPVHASSFDIARAGERLLEATGLATLQSAGAETMDAAQGAAGALLAYCLQARVNLAPGFVRLHCRGAGTTMRLDPQTRRNLELITPLGGTATALVHLLDQTRTPMGARLLRRRLQEPLLEPGEIESRLEGVKALGDDRDARHRLRAALTGVRDLERLVGRCVQGIATPRDLLAVGNACESIPLCGAALATTGRGELASAVAGCVPPAGLGDRILELLVDDPPASAREGGAVRSEADPELDSMVAAGAEARSYIAGLEERERSRTGIRSLRVGYNRVFGYYIEVPNAHRQSVPAGFIRKQTLAGAERYITAELKEHESTVLHARERAVAREVELLRGLAAQVAGQAATLLAAAGAVAVLDVTQSLATVADERGWVRPSVDHSARLDIEGGRHPLVEHALQSGRFVPNDCHLDAGGPQVIVLTGPNMAGKSTFLRQVGLIVLLAQTGSFVPATSAHVGICDRIFTRVGAHDDLGAGLSTFMVEMAETAAILQQASGRSLVILDEIGRGTSTYDGLSIAQAVLEHLHEAPHLGCRTLFATHYHELTGLAGDLARIRNARVEVVEEGDEVTFLHRVVDGGADRSYGIHVARLAGVPAGVLARARQLLAAHECATPLRPSPSLPDQLGLALGPASVHPVVEEIVQLDIDGLSPLAALNQIARWRERVRP